MPTDVPSYSPARPGPALASVLSLACLAVCVAAYWQGHGSVDTVRFIDRSMARTAAVLFSLTFTASALASLFPSGLTRWLVAQRRNLALAFAASFALHLCAIADFYALDPAGFWSVSTILLIVLRSIGVAFIGLMLTGPRSWKTLHAIGGWYVWGAFLNGFAKRVAEDPIYLVLAAMLVLVLVVRLAALWRARKAGSRPAGSK